VRRLTPLLVIGLVAAACQSEAAAPIATVAVATTTTTLPATTITTTTTTTTTTLTPTPTPTTIPAEPATDASAPRPDSSIPTATKGAAIVAVGGADLFRNVDGEPYVRAHEGLLLPIVGRDGEWLELLDHCDDTGWVRFDEVAFTAARGDTPPVGNGFAFSDAVIVVDPGHGGPNIGAVGPTGLIEKEVNLDIARRTRDLLSAPHSVDWETGEILDGSAIPPAGQVWLTRPEGPPGADIETGLTFRTAIANSVRAHALISIHNNAAPDGPYDGPGSEVYHQVTDLRSRRLSGLILEEMRRGFSVFEADWVGDDEAGAKVRVKENGRDIYGILRLSDIPAVIAEGVYISNPSEEALLRTPDFRQAYADAVYRALVRFITTDDAGSGFIDTEPFTAGGLSSGAPVQACTVAAQTDE
jgi:N-acetylmuramoyl-L-alanine amidase